MFTKNNQMTHRSSLLLVCLSLSIPFALISGCSKQNKTINENESATVAVEQPALKVVLPKASVMDMMVGTIETAGNTIWGAAMDENIPKTEADWIVLENAAIQLITAASAISLGGTGEHDMEWVKSNVWQAQAQNMADIGKEILSDIRLRKYDEMLEAGNLLVEPCGACHTAFPSETKISNQ